MRITKNDSAPITLDSLHRLSPYTGFGNQRAPWRASEYGATVEEVIEAIDVAIKMGGGSALVSTRFAKDVVKDVYEGMAA